MLFHFPEHFILYQWTIHSHLSDILILLIDWKSELTYHLPELKQVQRFLMTNSNGSKLAADEINATAISFCNLLTGYHS